MSSFHSSHYPQLLRLRFWIPSLYSPSANLSNSPYVEQAQNGLHISNNAVGKTFYKFRGRNSYKQVILCLIRIKKKKRFPSAIKGREVRGGGGVCNATTQRNVCVGDWMPGPRRGPWTRSTEVVHGQGSIFCIRPTYTPYSCSNFLPLTLKSLIRFRFYINFEP